MKTLFGKFKAWVTGLVSSFKAWVSGLVKSFVAFAIGAAHKQWYVVVTMAVLYLAWWNYGRPEANKYGVAFILLMFWLALVKFKFVKPKKEVKQ